MESKNTQQVQQGLWRFWSRRLTIIGLLTCLLSGYALLLILKWPFTYKAVVTAMEKETRCKVSIGEFHKTFFPPGYVAENVMLTRGPSNQNSPTVAVRRMLVTTRWLDVILARRRLEKARVSGLRMRIVGPPRGTRQQPESGEEQTTPRFSEVGKLQVDDAIFFFGRSSEADRDPFTIAVNSFSVENINRTSASPYQALISPGKPACRIAAEGQIGPFDWSHLENAALSGQFKIEEGDLKVYRGIRGTFTGAGSFSGPIRKVVCNGTVDVPEFRLTGHHHSTHLLTSYRAVVDGSTGDTTLNQVQAKFNHTEIEATGVIRTDAEQPGKDLFLEVNVEQGQIQDLLLPFALGKRAAMTGEVRLSAKVDLPPGPARFLEKLKIKAEFDINHGRFASERTQSRINDLSKSAEGVPKAEAKGNRTIIFSELRGRVEAQNGNAIFSRSQFLAPGAEASISGSYSLLDTRLHLRGLLRTAGKALRHRVRHASTCPKDHLATVEKEQDAGSAIHDWRRGQASKVHH